MQLLARPSMKKVAKACSLMGVAAVLATLFGVSVTRSSLGLLLVSVCTYYIFFITLLRHSSRLIYLVSLVYNFSAGLTLTLWFTKITATGWFDSIGKLNIKAWLVIFLVMASVVSAIFLAGIHWTAARIIKKRDIDGHEFKTLLFFSLMMTATEIGRQLLFALIVKSNGTPSEPVWGIFSAASTLPTSSAISKIPAIYGYWGTSYFFYFVGTTFGFSIITGYKAYKTKSLVSIYGVLGSIILITISIVFSNMLNPARLIHQRNSNLKAIATSYSNDNDYIKNLKEALLKRDLSKYTIVVLPEYDTVIHPEKNTPAVLITRKRTDDLLSVEQQNIYYVATQDDSWNYRRYALNYLGTKDDYIIKKSKKFLVPGGEYVVGWINQILTPFDHLATLEFKKTRGRYVIDSSKINKDTKPHELNSLISIGACSSVLSPYIFRKDINKGAQLIALNLSFAQFSKAPEYQLFTKKFMLLMANAYQRPVIAGVHDGEAMYVSPYGTNRLEEAAIVSDNIAYNQTKTLYTRLGDLNILLIIGGLVLTSIYYPTIKNKLKALTKSAKD